MASPPYAGKGHVDIRTYTSEVSPNSGYLSTGGPPTWTPPTCGTAKWLTRPNIWVNYTLIVQREAAGHATWNVSTVAHEAGHALGLNHNEGTSCASMPLMDADAADTNACNTYQPTNDEISGVDVIYT